MIKILRIGPENYNTIIKQLLSIEKKIFTIGAFDEEAFSTFKNPQAYNLIVCDGSKLIGYLMSQRERVKEKRYEVYSR